MNRFTQTEAIPLGNRIRWVQVAQEREPYRYVHATPSPVGFARLRDLDPRLTNLLPLFSPLWTN